MADPMHDRFMRLTIPQMLWVIVKLLCWGLKPKEGSQPWVVVGEVVTGFELTGKGRE